MVFTRGSAPRACVSHAERRSLVESRVGEELLGSWSESTSDHTLKGTFDHILFVELWRLSLNYSFDSLIREELFP